MNAHELRAAERKELMEIQSRLDSENFMASFSESEAVREKYRILRKEDLIITSWSFPAEEWATLSKEAKIIIINMADEADRYEYLREELQGWLEQAP